MNSQQDIQDVFSILHDGWIETWSGNRNKLVLIIGCTYLAELIDKSFEYFYVELFDIRKIEFFAWMNPISLEQKIFTELSEIFQAELEILSSDKKDDDVVVVCNQHDTKFDYCGGNLTLNCQNIKVFDQSKRQLSIEEFDEICKKYWNHFGQE